MKRTGIVRHERYIEHVMDRGHPESPDRLKAIYQMLDVEKMRPNGQWVEIVVPDTLDFGRASETVDQRPDQQC